MLVTVIVGCHYVKLYQFWVDGKTFVELTRPWYGKAVGFPFSMYLPLRKQSTSRTRLMSVFGSSCVNDTELETLVRLPPLSCFDHFAVCLFLLETSEQINCRVTTSVRNLIKSKNLKSV